MSATYNVTNNTASTITIIDASGTPRFITTSMVVSLTDGVAQDLIAALGSKNVVLIPSASANNANYEFTPLPPGQKIASLSPAQSLNVPAGATYAIISAFGGNVTYTTDGVTTPTASVGTPLNSGNSVSQSGPAILANFKAFSTSGSLYVEFFK